MNQIVAPRRNEHICAALRQYEDVVKFFSEEGQIRLVDSAAQIVRTQANDGLDVDRNCRNAIAFIKSVERGLDTGPSALRNEISGIKSGDYRGRREFVAAMNEDIPQGDRADADVSVGRLSPFMINEVNNIGRADCMNALDLFQDAMNKALGQHPTFGTVTFNHEAYARDLIHVTQQAMPLLDRFYEKLKASELQSSITEQRQSLIEGNRPRGDGRG